MQRLLARVSHAMALFSGAVLVLIMLIMFVDVVGRYFLNAPLTFSVELVELGMGVFVLFGLAQTTLHRGHISVDLLTRNVIGGFLDGVFNIVAALSAAVFIGIVSWRLFLHANRLRDDGLFTQVLELPLYPFVYLMFAASVVATVVALALVIRPGIDHTHTAEEDGFQTRGE